MVTNENIEGFYQRKFDSVPDSIRKDIGHFNVFRLQQYDGSKEQSVPYRKRDFYKISLVKGQSKIYYADEVIEVKKQALTFSNPRIPYKYENLEGIKSCHFCIFDELFFHQFGDLDKYSVFQPGGTHVFELTDVQLEMTKTIFDRMFEEIESDYIHKYDALRAIVYELLHYAMKMHPSSKIENQEEINASRRISIVFEELLERQFPIEIPQQPLSLRSASDYADRLNVHVNHLNRALKETTGKTTTQLISERILKEAKILLKHSQWNVSEISDALGFSVVSHFNKFFKKHIESSPTEFRKAS